MKHGLGSGLEGETKRKRTLPRYIPLLEKGREKYVENYLIKCSVELALGRTICRFLELIVSECEKLSLVARGEAWERLRITEYEAQFARTYLEFVVECENALQQEYRFVMAYLVDCLLKSGVSEADVFSVQEAVALDYQGRYATIRKAGEETQTRQLGIMKKCGLLIEEKMVGQALVAQQEAVRNRQMAEDMARMDSYCAWNGRNARLKEA